MHIAYNNNHIKSSILDVNTQEHPYFLVTPSIVPMLTSISVLFFVTEILNFFYSFSYLYFLYFSFLALVFILFEWFFNVTKESDYHTKQIQFNNKLAFMLFIGTEIMFFFSMFWTFFHASLAPAIAFDNQWPPRGLSVINAFGPPIWGTWILWLSGLYALRIKDLMIQNHVYFWREILDSFNAVLFLGFCFTLCQVFEFFLATFSFREGIYGSIFYLLTGFHGIHVVIGTAYLIICWFRFYFKILRDVPSSDFWFKKILLSEYFSNNFFSLKIKKSINLFSSKSEKLKIFTDLLFFKNKLVINLKQKNTNLWEPSHFSGLETAVWYWQFVDIVWIFVWIIIYVWGNNSLPFLIKLEIKPF